MNVLWKGKEIQLPDFIIIGAAKSGTSSLNYYLSIHSQVFMTEPKEPNFFAFFNHDHLYEKQLEIAKQVGLLNYDLNDYSELFQGADGRVCGEASTCYIQYHKSVIPNLKMLYGDRIGDLKLLLLLRNPVDKVFSHYQMFVKWGVEKRAFSEVLKQELSGLDVGKKGYVGYTETGFYADAVSSFNDAFGANLKIFMFEELCADREKIVSESFDFLGINPLDDSSSQHLEREVNVGGLPKGKGGRLFYKLFLKGNVMTRWLSARLKHFPLLKDFLKTFVHKVYFQNLSEKIPLSPEDRNVLISYYRKDIKETEKIVNRDLSSWLRS